MTKVSRPKKGLARAGTLFLATVLNASVAHAQATLFIGHNFTGEDGDADSAPIPPDTMGARGPNDRFVEILNSRFSIYNTSFQFPSSDPIPFESATLETFWNNALDGLPFPFGSANDAFDPRILFDPFSQRWFAVAADGARSASSRVLVAVTTGSDPGLANWEGFAINANPAGVPGAQWADFPTLGINRDGLYISVNMLDIPNDGIMATPGATLIAIPKSSLTAADPSISGFVRQTVTPIAFTFQPAVDRGNTPLPHAALSTTMQVQGGTSYTGYNIPAQFLTDPNDPSGQLTSFSVMPVDPLSNPPNAPQPAPLLAMPLFTGTPFPATGPHFSGNVVLQDGSLWAAQTVAEPTSGNAAIRWFEIDEQNFFVKQTGIIADPTLHFFFPSIAVNEFGHVVIGFSSSGTAAPEGFASSRAVGGFTQNGVTAFGNPVLLKQGTAPYQILDSMGRNRWGDYSATTIDPNNPQKFWTIQEWSSGTDFEFLTDGGDWSTQITELEVALEAFVSPGDPPRPAGGADTDDPAGAPKGGHYGSERPQHYGRDVELGRIRLREFTDLVLIGDTPENVSDMQTQRFNALLDATLKIGSDSFTLSAVPAELELKVTLTFIDGNSDVFDSELQLLGIDLGRTLGLPFDAEISLDPNRPSVGRSVVTELSPGRFVVNSYLDVFTELAIDADRDGVRDQLLVADRSSRLLLAPEPVPGDYNNNGTVDAADYVVWRDNLGSGTSLPNDETPGVGPDDYDRWKANFGQNVGSGSLSKAAVPESASALLLMLAVAGWSLRRRRAASKVPATHQSVTQIEASPL